MDSKSLFRRFAPTAGALLVFDLDGTLLDTMDDITAAVNYALARQQRPPLTREQVAPMVGNGVFALAQKALCGQGDESAFLAAYHTHYRAHLYDRTVPYPGIPALLYRLKQAGYQLAVLSNKPQAETERLIAHFFGQGLFSIVWGQTDNRPKKPDPAAPLALAKALSALPEQSAMIGDSDVDMQTAAAAGWLPLGVSWGYRAEAALWAAGAEILVNSAEELGNVLIYS